MRTTKGPELLEEFHFGFVSYYQRSKRLLGQIEASIKPRQIQYFDDDTPNLVLDVEEEDIE
jgi:hypothetical protein